MGASSPQRSSIGLNSTNGKPPVTLGFTVTIEFIQGLGFRFRIGFRVHIGFRV